MEISKIRKSVLEFYLNRRKTLDEEFKVLLKATKVLKHIRKMDIDCGR